MQRKIVRYVADDGLRKRMNAAFYLTSIIKMVIIFLQILMFLCHYD